MLPENLRQKIVLVKEFYETIASFFRHRPRAPRIFFYAKPSFAPTHILGIFAKSFIISI
jgi:hypothetical protein